MEDFDMNTKQIETWYKTVDTKEQAKFQDWLKSHLKMGAVELTFQKKDGTMRIMNCTLEESKLPVYEKKTERTKTVSTESLSVRDLDKNEWRSFRYDSIQQIAFKLA